MYPVSPEEEVKKAHFYYWFRDQSYFLLLGEVGWVWVTDWLSDLRFTLVAPEFLSRRVMDLQISWKRVYGTCLEASFAWHTHYFYFSSVQSLSHVQLFVTPWTAAHQASLSITNSRSLLKLRSIKSVIPSNHLILCHPLLLLPPIPPSIRVFSNESLLRIRWPKYWSFSLSISPSNKYSGSVCIVIGKTLM